MPNEKEATCPKCLKKPGTWEVIHTKPKDGYSNHYSALICKPCGWVWSKDTGWLPYDATEKK